MNSRIITIAFATAALFLAVASDEEHWRADYGQLFYHYDNHSYAVSTTKWRDIGISLRRSGNDRICVNVTFFDQTVDQTVWPRYRVYEEHYIENSNLRTMRRTRDMFAIRNEMATFLIGEWSSASDGIIISGANAVTAEGESPTCSVHVTLRIRSVYGKDAVNCEGVCIRNDTIYINERETYHVFPQKRKFVSIDSNVETVDDQELGINLNLLFLRYFTHVFWGIGRRRTEGTY